MQARIKRDDLIAFKEYASKIKKNNELPILSFLKVEVVGDFVSISKSNLVSFVVQTTANDSEDCSFLVDENIVFNFIELSDGEFINFSITGVKITITDGRHKMISPTENSALFPMINLTNTEWTTIPKSALDAIKICAEIVFDDEISGLKNSVFVGKGAVAGSDASIAYWQKFTESLPEIVLRKQVAMAVGALPNCEVSSNPSYDLFKCNNALFGFSKSEIKFVELVPVFGEPVDNHSFYLNKTSLIKWNSFCINSCKSKSLTAEWKAEKNRLELELADTKYELNSNSFIDIHNGSGEFRFNPSTLNQILKVLPVEQIYFYPKTNISLNYVDRYYMSDSGKTFMSAIMLII